MKKQNNITCNYNLLYNKIYSKIFKQMTFNVLILTLLYFVGGYVFAHIPFIHENLTGKTRTNMIFAITFWSLIAFVLMICAIYVYGKYFMKYYVKYYVDYVRENKRKNTR